jgi:hypothetical protein
MTIAAGGKRDARSAVFFVCVCARARVCARACVKGVRCCVGFRQKEGLCSKPSPRFQKKDGKTREGRKNGGFVRLIKRGVKKKRTVDGSAQNEGVCSGEGGERNARPL